MVPTPSSFLPQEAEEQSPVRKYMLAGAVAVATIAAIYLYSAPSQIEEDRRDDGRVGIQPWTRYYSEFVAAPGTYSDEDARQFEPPGTFDDVPKTAGETGGGFKGGLPGHGVGTGELQGTGIVPDYCR